MGKMINTISGFDRRVNERYLELAEIVKYKGMDSLLEGLEKSQTSLKAEVKRLQSVYGSVKDSPLPERQKVQQLCMDIALFAELIDKQMQPDTNQKTLGGE